MQTPVPPLEQAHIDRALAAAQTSMDAISTVTSVASYTLAVLGVFIAILAIWGIKEIVDRAKEAAERIANKRLASYIASDEFSDFVKDRIDKAVEAHWQAAQIDSIGPDRNEGDQAGAAFPPAPGEGQ